jgi:hypothetical protein
LREFEAADERRFDGLSWRFPITSNLMIGQESLKSQMAEQVLIEKVRPLFRNLT